MRKINHDMVYTIAQSLVRGPAGSLELKRRVDKHLNRNLPRDTFYRYKEISKGLGIIDSKPGAKKVRGGYQTLHFLTERGKKYMTLGLNIFDPEKYQYHKNNYEIVSVGDWTDDDDVYRLFLILASIDTIESAHVEEIYAHDENEILERLRVLVPMISTNDLVIARKEKRIDGCILTYYKPVFCLQIVKKEVPATVITKRRESKKRTLGKNMGTSFKAIQDQEQQENQAIDTDVSVIKRKITLYHLEILGASASEIVRYNKGDSKIGQKFTGMFARPLSLTRVKKTLSILQREQLISSMGKLKGETRYTITDGILRRFIGSCLVIQDQIMSLMNNLWSYRIRKVDSYDRRWLQMIYGHRNADRIISSNFAFLDDDDLIRSIEEKLSRKQELSKLSNRSSPDLTGGSGNGSSDDNRKAAIRAEIEESRRQIEQESRVLKRYIRKQIKDLEAIYMMTFSNYHFPLERIMQLVVLPSLKNKS